MPLYIDPKILAFSPKITSRDQRTKISLYVSETGKLSISIPTLSYKEFARDQKTYFFLTARSIDKNCVSPTIHFYRPHTEKREITFFILFVAKNAQAFIPSVISKYIDVIKKLQKSDDIIYLLKVRVPNETEFPIYFIKDNFEFEDMHYLVSKKYQSYMLKKTSIFKGNCNYENSDLVNL